MDYLEGEIIPGDKLFTMPSATSYEFGILMSNVHMAWTRAVCGRLKSDYSYSNMIVYNNFPWPSPINDQKEKIRKTAQAILNARALYTDSNLADLYDPLTMPSLQDYYDKKTQGRLPLPNFYAEMKRRGKNLSNLQEFAKSINYLQTHQIETMDDLKERIDELNGVVSVSKKEISEKRDQLKKLENLQKMAEVIKINQPLIDEYNRFYFQKRREKYYQQHKKEINYYRKCERELKQHLDKNGKVPTARWKREKEELRTAIEELKADKQPYQDELAFVKKVQTCADIARRDREMAEADTSGRSEEKSEKQTKFPAFHAAQTEDIFEESGKAEQQPVNQPVNQQEKKPEKKTSLLRKLDEKKKECAERDAKQQAVREKRNHEMSL